MQVDANNGETCARDVLVFDFSYVDLAVMLMCQLDVCVERGKRRDRKSVV